MSDDNQDMINMFAAESRDMLDDVEPVLVELKMAAEKGETIPAEDINAIFRSFHTIKGTSAFLELYQIQGLVHEAETLLDLYREGKLTPAPPGVELLFNASDLLRQLLDVTDETLSDAGLEDDVAGLVGQLSAAAGGDLPPDKPVPLPPEPAEEEKAAEGAFPEFDTVEDEAFSFDDDIFNITITPEMKANFVQESDELLETAEQDLLKLKEDPTNLEPVAEAFRCLHSLKSNCGLFELGDLERLSHRLEAILDKLRNNEMSYTPTVVSSLLGGVDLLRTCISDFSSNDTREFPSTVDFISQLDNALTGETAETKPLGELLLEKGQVDPDDLSKALDVQQAPLGEILVDMGAVAPENVEAALEQQEKTTPKASRRTKAIARKDIRVDVDKLDALINLVGELVISQVMVIQNKDLEGLELSNFEKSAHHLTRITMDLQDVAMSIRMVPVAGTFRKMIRVVHDTATKSGKKVNLDLDGEDTEVDKTVLELISDPLVHIIRNAVDHGIESREGRREAGKPETGRVVLSAKHEAGEIWITIADDGGGLSRDRILAKAKEKELINSDGSDLTDKEVFQLIFEPGFSTAAAVTDVSGRGVGMDVVKKNIERISGRIDIDSILGKGTTFTLRIPLTMAIIEGMLVQVGEGRYTIPILGIRESLRPQADQVTVTPQGDEMVKIHGRFVPILRLNKIFGIHGGVEDLTEGLLVVVAAQGDEVALLVDEILGQHQTVIKQLSSYLQGAPGISGCTILSDGSVSLIVDTISLLEHLKKVSL